MTHIPYESLRALLSDQRILLVGGAGFIGHNFALELARLGAAVEIVDNLAVNNLIDNGFDPSRDPVRRHAYQSFLMARFAHLREAGIGLRCVDARQSLDLAGVVESFDPTKIVHMAAIASAVDARHTPGLAFDLQLGILRHVLEIARLRTNRVNQVMLMSSSTVYGDFKGDSVDEDTPKSPKGIYATAKLMGEQLLETYRDQYGVGTTVIRPSALYGERCISRRVSQIFIENALTGKPLLLEGGGDGKLDFTYITDLVQGMVRAAALHRGVEDSETFNLTYGRARTIAELAGIVSDIIPKAILEERPRAKDKPVRGTLSTARAQAKLGFRAKWGLDTGYRRYCEWYVEQWERAKRGVVANI